MNRAVFLDRDGTLNEMVFNPEHGVFDSPFTPEQLVLKRGAASFVAALNRAGFKVIVVTNQPGCAKGTMTEERLRAIHERFLSELGREGARVHGVYYCPHHPTGALGGDARLVGVCECRKPKPGLLVRAAPEHEIDLRASFMVGDGTVDVEAGRAAGVTTVLVAPRKPELMAFLEGRPESVPDIWVESLEAALHDILSRGRLEQSVCARNPSVPDEGGRWRSS